MKALTKLGSFTLCACLSACGGHHDDPGHSHGPGADHSHDEEPGASDHHADDHVEEPLGQLELGDLTLTLAQGHGAVRAGEESHLVVSLSDDDGGATVVRAWIGGEDRTLAYVGKGTYAADHAEYDLHVTAPDPLPDDARWWIELERPDGSTLVGSIEPLRE